jgi:hypothetical protein
MLGLDVARAETESFFFVVTNERLAARIADDNSAGFGEDGTAAFLALSSCAAEVVEAARLLRGCSRRNRRQCLSRRRRGGNRCGDRWRRVTS